MATVTVMVMYAMVSFYHVYTQAPVDFPWETVDNVLNTVCSETKVCEHVIGHDVNSTFRFGQTRSPLACCPDCSCEEDCYLHGNCCFPKVNSAYSGRCMFPRTKFQYQATYDDEPLEGFYIIDSPPSDGCVIQTDTGCQSDDVLQYLPVSSSDGVIYYNQNCARCHGKESVKPWQAAFFCNKSKEETTIDVAYELKEYVKHSKSSPCYFIFYYDTDISREMKQGPCRIAEDDRRFLKYNVSTSELSNLNITDHDIKSLCFSSFNLPYYGLAFKKWFFNPFCYFYEGGLPNNCLSYAKGRPIQLLSKGFTALMSYSTVFKFVSKEEIRGSMREACRKTKYTAAIENEDFPRCRPIICPIGHVMDVDMKCSLLSSTILLAGRRKISIQIRLIALDRNVYFKEIGLENITMADVEKAMPWSDTWDIIFVGYALDKFNVSLGGKELLVCFLSKHGNLRQTIDEINRFITQPITLTVSGTVTIFTQRLYEQTVHGEWGIGDVVTSPLFDLVMRTGNTSAVAFEMISWKVITYKNIFLQQTIIITKLFLCNQVELLSSEFVMVVDNYLLYYPVGGTLLYETEFRLLDQDKGNMTRVRVCADDAGFDIPRQGCSCLHYSYFAIFAIHSLVINLL